MPYKTVSAKSIVGRTMSSFGLKDASILYEALEWIGDGIAEIGYSAGLVNKYQKIEVVNHTIDTPMDMFELNYFIYNGQKLSYGMKPGGYNGTQSVQITPLYNELVTLINARNYSLDYADGEIDIDGCIPCEAEQYKLLDANEMERVDNKIKATLKAFKTTLPTSTTEYFLDSEGDCYKTSIEEGYVVAYYKAYPVDNDGYPLVIDEMKYKMALEYVVMERLMRGGKQHPNISYGDIRKEKDLWIARARNEQNKFNDEQMESFTENWTNMMFHVQKQSNYYSNG